jgi:hypothetical protein
LSTRDSAEKKQSYCWHGHERKGEIAQAVRDVHIRLQWIPLDFGEPLREFKQLGIQVGIGAIAPLVVKFGVDAARRVVYVSLPFDLLPKSGL